MDIHAGVYGRQSIRRESGSEISTADQLSHGLEEAKRRNAAHIATYEDLGISAFSGVERPDFERMLHDCRMGRLNMVIVYYISRLSRLEVMDAIPIVTELLQKGVTIVSITEGTFRPGDMMDLIHLIFRLDAAHKESLNKSRSVRSAKATAKALGGWSGPAPYGFETHDDSATVIGQDGRTRLIGLKRLRPQQSRKDPETPSEVEIGLRIFRAVLEHMDKPYDPGYSKFHPGSISGVTTALNRDGIATRGASRGRQRKASQWDRKTVARILMDPRWAGYQGEPIYSEGPGRKTIGYRLLRDENGDPLETPWAPLVPRADWWKVQTWMSGRSETRGLSRGETLLGGCGILFCACQRTYRKAKYPSGALAYRCSRAQGTTDVHTGQPTIGVAVLDDYIARRIYGVISTAEGDEWALSILAAAAERFARAQEAPQALGERAALLAERAEVVRGLEELYDERDAGGFRSEVGRRRFRKAETGLEERLTAADSALAALDSAARPVLPIGQWMPEDPSVDPVGPGSWWHRASLEDRRELVKLFIQRIEILPLRQRRVGQPAHERVRIYWHGEADANAA